MKKFTFILMITFCGLTSAFAQTSNEEQNELVSQLNSPSPNYALLASQFKSLADTDNQNWLLSYYYIYSTTMQAYSEKGEKIDQLLDAVEPILRDMEKRQPQESELYVLEAMINQARISVEPKSRGMKYFPIYSQLLEKAIIMNPENPRAYLIKGLGIMHMPEAFGGGKKNALPVLEMANAKFESYKPTTEQYPTWGREFASYMLQECKK